MAYVKRLGSNLYSLLKKRPALPARSFTITSRTGDCATGKTKRGLQEQRAPSRNSNWLLCYSVSTVSHPDRREASIKITLSFQNLEAALPPGIPAGRRSSSP